jgi:tetratricopeptide (TPR) repeat protein
MGGPETAISYLKRALRLSPLDAWRNHTLTLMARACNVRGNPAGALPFVAESLRLRPNFPGALVDSVVANVLCGHLDLARRHLVEYRMIYPESRISTFREGAIGLSQEGWEIYIDALRKAGLPE